VLLVNTNVDQVHLEISEFKDKALEEDGSFVPFLCLVVLHFGGSRGNFSELFVSHSSEDGLDDRRYHIKVAFGIKNSAFVGKSGEDRDIKHTSMIAWADSSCDVQKADDAKADSTPAGEALSETSGVKGESLPRREGVLVSISDRVVLLRSVKVFTDNCVLLSNLVDIPFVF
jgi:hypothetical protein